jgi:hypothetical protein
MVANGYKWLQWLQWLQMVTNGCKWLQMVTNGYKWLQMVTNGYKWLQIQQIGNVPVGSCSSPRHNMGILQVATKYSSSDGCSLQQFDTRIIDCILFGNL